MKVEFSRSRSRVLARAIGAAVFLAAAPAVESAANYPLGTLPATAGFRLEGADAGSRAGYAVASIGDVNGDGVEDVLLGACERCELDPGPATSPGRAYVVFGRATGFAATTPLSALDGTNGFRLDGVTLDDRTGYSVAGGVDLNGDTRDDFVIGAPRSDIAATDAGSTFVVFGRPSTASFPATLALASLDGATGFRIDGVAAGDQSGGAVAAIGDIDGNGVADLAIGARHADPNGVSSGTVYVVHGRTTPFPAALALSALDGSNGFRIAGVAAGDETGAALAAAGDVNEDGRADLVIGAPFTDPVVELGGATYVVFGRATPFPAAFDLTTLDGTNGFRLTGVASNDRSGSAVAGGGDINGDGIADLLVGAFAADPNSVNAAGSTYVVFGRATAFAPSIALASLDGTTGFRIDGAAAGDVAGRAVSAGDVNGDGFDDVAIGADLADPNGADSGSAYLVFGRAGGFPAALALASLGGSNGVRFTGAAAFDHTGFSLSRAGDVDDDGLADLAIGAEGVDAGGTNAGRVYVVRGNAAPLRSGTATYPLSAGSVLEDAGAAPGAALGALLGPVYLDAEAFAGAAITASPATTQGVWQYSTDAGANWTAVPAGLSASGALVLAPDAQVRFVPASNFSGDSVALSLRMWDGADGFTPGTGRDVATSIGSLGGFSNDANSVPVVVSVAPVNDAPSFAADNPPATVATGSEVVVTAWALFSAGPSSESTQSVQEYLVGGITNPGLFTANPTVDPSGTLRYTPASGAVGTSDFTVRVRDNGGTANGGVDLSPAQTFTITLATALDPIFADGFE